MERVIEANTLLSGVGGENVPLAAAHAIHNGFTALDGDIHHLSHGEKVAYGILTQLVLEGYDKDYIDKYIFFFKKINMPTTLEELHLEDVDFDELFSVGEVAVSEDETIINMDPTIIAEDVANAILTVDKLSKTKN